MEAAAAAGRAAAGSAAAAAADEPEPEPEPEPVAVEAWMGNDPVLVAALETVGLAAGATEEALRKAFHRSALKWHPDKNPSAEAKQVHVQSAICLQFLSLF